MEIGEQYKLPLIKTKWIKVNFVKKIWYYDTYGQPVLDYINRLKIKDNCIKATVHKIHRTYIEFLLENNRIVCLKHEQASQLEKFL